MVSSGVRLAAIGSVLTFSASIAIAVALPVEAQAADRGACPKSVSEAANPTAASEDRAVRLAIACRKPIEVLSRATETTRLTALPSGTLSFEATATPTRVQKAGLWRAIDPRLTVGADGKLRPVATAGDVVFSPGGDGPFASISGRGADFTLAWPTTLPPGVVSGDSVTYPNVYPDVDLVVRATSGGFSHVLVVKTAAAAANAAVREATYRVGGSARVTEVGGGVSVTGPGGAVASAAPPKAWDSAPSMPSRATVAKQRAQGGLSATKSGEVAGQPGGPPPSSAQGPGDAAKVGDVQVRISGETMTVAADQSLLNSDQFPIFIDPTYDQGPQRWIPTSKQSPDRSWTSGSAWPREVARVGSNYDNHSDVWRANFQFDISVLKGKRIVNTPSVEARAVHSGWCAGESVGLWQTNLIGTPTWKGMQDSWLNRGALETKTAKANSKCSGQGDHWLKYISRIGELLQAHANNNSDHIAFGLRMKTESDGHWAKFDPTKVLVKAEYAHRPYSPEPTRTAPGGGCDRNAPGNWISDNTPTLYGKAQDGDGTVQVRFDLTGPTDPAVYTSPNVGSNGEADWTTPGLADGNYDYRVEGFDGAEYTGWSYQCFFRVDASPPATPTIRRTSGAPVVGQPVTIELSSSDGGSGLKQFEYGIGVDTRQQAQPSSGTSSITFTPEPGRTLIYVWAQDTAGNYSARAVFDTYTGRITESVPRAVWRFDGDMRDDSGASRNLRNSGPAAEAGTVGFGTDRWGRAGSALSLSGQNCAVSEPVMRSDVEFTVAGWVKINSKSVYQTMITQSTGGHLFTLEYASYHERWAAYAGNGLAVAPTQAPIGTWQHVAATVDPVARVVRLYIDGRFAAAASAESSAFSSADIFVGCDLDGSIDDLAVWEGLLSEEQIVRAATELPPGLAGTWELRGSGANSKVAANGAAVPNNASWVEDPFGRSRSALALDGSTCARTAAPAVRTDESFTVSAWAKASNEPYSQTFVGQDGSRVSGFFLGTRYEVGRPAYWRLMMPVGDTDEPMSAIAGGAPETAVPVQPNVWTHLTGVYEATARKLSLYVDGRLASTATVPSATNWNAGGPLTIGCGKWAGGVADRVRNGAVSDVRTWFGALSAAQVAAVHGGVTPVALESLWPLDGPDSDDPTYLTDISGKGRNLSISGPYEWVRDRGLGRDGALGLQLAAGSCAQTAGPSVRTDASFTVAAWVLLDRADGVHTVVSQAGNQRAGFQLDYSKDANKWRFAMASSDGASPTYEALSHQAPTLGKWTHLVGVYDLTSRKIRLYVNGELQPEAAAPEHPWAAVGPTFVGCAGTLDGERSGALNGVVDDVRIWTSTLHPDRIADLANADLTPAA